MFKTPINKKRQIAKARSEFYKSIRAFFEEQHFVETETPVLSASLIPESAIEVFQTQWKTKIESQVLYLTPSPEIYMKQLISEGIGDCYQITKSFRNAEDKSNRHLCEFTMLEWYAMDKNYIDNLEITQALLRHLAPLASTATRHFFEEFVTVSMAHLFQEYVGIDLNECQSLESFKIMATQAGFAEYAEKSDTWETLFHFIFVSHIETELPQDKTVFIINYPAQIPATARKNQTYYERFEFYMKGWEIANCYTEEAEYDVMLQLFREEEQLKNEMLVPHQVDYDYLSIFKDGGFPPCSGCALGVDRLLAIAMNVESLEEISIT